MTIQKKILLAVVFMTGLGVIANPLCIASTCDKTSMSDCCACDHSETDEGSIVKASCCSIDSAPVSAPAAFIKATPSDSGIKISAITTALFSFDPSASSPTMDRGSTHHAERTPQRVNLRI